MVDEIATTQRTSSAPYVGAGAILGAGAGYAAISIAKDKNPIRKWAEEPKYKSHEDLIKEAAKNDKIELSGASDDLKNQFKTTKENLDNITKTKEEVKNKMKTSVDEFKKKVSEIMENAKKEGKIKEDGKLPDTIKEKIETERKNLGDKLKEIRKNNPEIVKNYNECAKNYNECAKKVFEAVKDTAKKLNIGKTALIIGAPAMLLAMFGGLAASKNK